MAGLFEAFQRGSNMADAQRRAREQDEIQREELEYRRGRRAKVDPLQDKLLEHQVGESDFNASTRPMRLRSAELGVEGQEVAVGRQRHAAERDPIVAQQQDQQFGLNVESTRQGMRLRERADRRADVGLGLQQRADSRAERGFNLAQQMQELQLDEAQIESQRRQAERMWMSGKQRVAQLASTGKQDQAAQMLQAMYETVDDGNPDNGVKFHPQMGWYLADEQGQPIQPIGDGGTDALLQFVDTYIGTPELFQQAYVSNRAAAAERAKFEAEEAGKNNRAIVSALGRALQPNDFGRAPDRAAAQPMIDAMRGVIGGAENSGVPPGARQGADGNWYVPDPKRPGKYLRIDP